MSLFDTYLTNRLEELKAQSNYRELPAACTAGEVINLASNDYLHLTHHVVLKQQFLKQLDWEKAAFSAASSRLIQGNHPVFSALEQCIADFYQRESALFFNSGYHMNTGILPAITTRHSVILADKWVHASLIDGIKLSPAQTIRYRHHDYDQLEKLVHQYHQTADFVVIVTESIFSMDGDVADLSRLAALKKRYANVLLYVDEAHAVGVRGDNGGGIAEEQGCIASIDFLCGTAGKALAAEGGFVVCNRVVKDFLINRCRSFIFTTAQSPFQVQWLSFVWQQLPYLQAERTHLCELSTFLRGELSKKGFHTTGDTQIIPLIFGDNQTTLEKARRLSQLGFIVQGIRPPTVPQGTSRLRLSLHAGLTKDQLTRFLTVI